MSAAKSRSPVTRLAVAILVIVVLLTIAIGVTISRYDHALSESDAAQESTSEVHSTQEAVTAFWHQREAMNEYLLIPDREILGEIEEQRAEFAGLAEDLPPGDHQEREARLTQQAAKANDAYVELFLAQRDRPDVLLSGSTRPRKGSRVRSRSSSWPRPTRSLRPAAPPSPRSARR